MKTTDPTSNLTAEDIAEMHASPLKAPPQAGAIPEPTPEDLEIDLEIHNKWAGESGHGLLQALIRRLAAAERDRDDARRRVSELERAGNELIKHMSVMCEECLATSICKACRSMEAKWNQALAAPGTGGTTGGTT
jgi:hypothetical protein